MDELDTSFFRITLTWSWKHCVCQHCWYLPTKPYILTPQKTIVLTLSATKTWTFITLFIFYLCSDAVTVWCQVTVNSELERTWKEAALTKFSVLSCSCLEVLRKTSYNLGIVSILAGVRTRYPPRQIRNITALTSLLTCKKLRFPSPCHKGTYGKWLYSSTHS
jgi:hypothetical protein